MKALWALGPFHQDNKRIQGIYHMQTTCPDQMKSWDQIMSGHAIYQNFVRKLRV